MSACVILIIILMIIAFVILNLAAPYTVTDILGNVSLFLIACMIGIVAAAVLAVVIIHCLQATKNTSRRVEGWQILSDVKNNQVPAPNSTSYVKNQKSMSVVSPLPPCQCHVTSHAGHQPRAMTQSNVTQRTHKTLERVQTGSEIRTKIEAQHKKVIGNLSQLNFTSGNTFYKTQRDSPVAAHKGYDNPAFDEDRSTPQNPSHLESYC